MTSRGVTRAFSKTPSALSRKLAKLGLHSPEDLELHLPHRYEDETVLVPIDAAPPGVPVQVEAKLSRAEPCGENRGIAKDCVVRSNKLLYESTSPEKFVTLFYSILDPVRHELVYCNAGHDHPFLLSPGKEPVRLKTGGIVVSIMDQFPFDEAMVQLQPGDTVVVYSDGIPEAMNQEKALFGEERLTELLLKSQHLSAVELIDTIISTAKAFAGRMPQSDDMTIIVVKRKAE